MVGVIPNHLVRGSQSSTMQVAIGLFHRACSQQSAQGMGVGIIRDGDSWHSSKIIHPRYCG